MGLTEGFLGSVGGDNISKGNIVYAHMVPKELTGTVDKYYIGITSQSVRKRWGRGGKNYHGSHFFNAISKYGWRNMRHIILLENIDRKVAEEIEKYLIEKYRTNDSNHGYNISPGGDGGNKKKMHKVAQYDMDGNFIRTYESAAEAGRAVMVNRTNITHACKTNGVSRGYQWRYDSNAVNIGRYLRKTQYPVAKLDEGGNILEVFSSLKEASVKTGISADNISHVLCNGKWRRAAGGYLWKRWCV